jgi:hypothetical protein
MKNELTDLDERTYIVLTCNSSFSYPKERNGLPCPNCGCELIDTHPNVTVTAVSPNKTVSCSRQNCGYSGYRNA